MKSINIFVNEKLRINKDTEVDYTRYILFHKNDPFKQWVAGIHKNLFDVGYYIKNHASSIGAHDVYKCHDDLVKEFIWKWKYSADWKSYKCPVDNDKELKEWCEENQIKKISANEINKYLR